jgi:hypothetical protein
MHLPVGSETLHEEDVESTGPPATINCVMLGAPRQGAKDEEIAHEEYGEEKVEAGYHSGRLEVRTCLEIAS